MIVVLHDSPDLYDREYQRVRAAFVADGTTLNRFLKEEGIDRQLAYRALRGRSFGRRALEIRTRLLREADSRLKRAPHG